MNIVEDYVAVVFAGGRGNRMLSITEHIPKHLLPIINIPLFWFPLNLLQRNGFKECLLIVPKTKADFINKLLSDGSLPNLDQLKVTILSFDDEEEGAEEFGTADVLLQNLDKLKKKNVLIVSGDLITDLTLEEMLKFHENENSVLTCLLTDSPLSGAIPGTNERLKKYRDFLMFSPETNQLLYLIDEDDFGDDEKFPASLFKSSPHIQTSAKYKDIHLYAIKRDALNSLKNSKLSFSSLKADFISNLICGQFSKSKRRSLGFNEQQKYKCFAYFGNSNDCSFLAQCNNLGAYFEANKIIKKFLPKLCDNLDSKFLGKQTNKNQSENWIAENTQISTKFQLKRSVISEGCIIGDNVKIDNCLVLSNVKILDGANIKNSIILNNSQIGEQVNISMCIITPKQKIPKKAKINSSIICEEKEMNLNICE
uniref:Translation initiation factor eIF2B subunit gamma n=1 Tax=Meloidogyne enterolobii TaxID=390850 RepID=A0A6V7X778_MELEN|nr:unnamed protein product [Meloidogyne enterolobii]